MEGAEPLTAIRVSVFLLLEACHALRRFRSSPEAKRRIAELERENVELSLRRHLPWHRRADVVPVETTAPGGTNARLLGYLPDA